MNSYLLSLSEPWSHSWRLIFFVFLLKTFPSLVCKTLWSVCDTYTATLLNRGGSPFWKTFIDTFTSFEIRGSCFQTLKMVKEIKAIYLFNQHLCVFQRNTETSIWYLTVAGSDLKVSSESLLIWPRWRKIFTKRASVMHALSGLVSVQGSLTTVLMCY